MEQGYRNTYTSNFSICFFAVFFVTIIAPAALSAKLQTAANSSSFFPLDIGNKWITQDPTELPPNNMKFCHQVVDTIRFNGNLYYKVIMHDERFFREDTLGHFYELKEGVEFLLMDFNMAAGDSMPIEGYHSNCSGFIRCMGRDSVDSFIGHTTEQLDFLFDWYPEIIDEEQVMILQQGVGIVEFRIAYHWPEYLQGVVINGIVYGDTTMTIVKVENEMPTDFKLLQNYPNPFNPSTTIEYSLPHHGHVALTITNNNGQIVEMLVNEFQNAGRHSIDWHPHHLSSGVYFYRLNFSGQSFTKKMQLLF